MQDPFNLNRFIEAQDASYNNAIRELRAGRKSSHWSWFVFPQVIGLGSSAMSIKYALSGLDEAKAYFNHPILGARLKETVAALLDHEGTNASHILGDVDAKKLQSCLTIFNLVGNHENLFQKALDKYFDGKQDIHTLDILAKLNKGD
jgi:uncharacterized protein (DUF1810 family)